MGFHTYTIVTATLMIAGLLASYAQAQGLCGDDVAGARVACRCGDVVVSDTSLRADDPVVVERCASDGLIVRAPSDTATIRLNLGGLSLLGSGTGTGVRVISGGHDGAVIEGGGGAAQAVVAGFGTGLRATGRRSVAEVSGIDFNANVRDGLALWGMEVRLLNVGADKNGRDGVHVGGRQPDLSDVRADANGRYGVRVTGAGARLEEGSARGNRRGNVVADRRSGVESK